MLLQQSTTVQRLQAVLNTALTGGQEMVGRHVCPRQLLHQQWQFPEADSSSSSSSNSSDDKCLQ